MKSTIAFCAALACAAAASSALAETTVATPRVRRPAIRHANPPVPPAPAEKSPNQATIPPFSWLTLFPNVKPYPPGEGDADGLSRNIEDCNKGCVDNPIR